MRFHRCIGQKLALGISLKKKVNKRMKRPIPTVSTVLSVMMWYKVHGLRGVLGRYDVESAPVTRHAVSELPKPHSPAVMALSIGTSSVSTSTQCQSDRQIANILVALVTSVMGKGTRSCAPPATTLKHPLNGRDTLSAPQT